MNEHSRLEPQSIITQSNEAIRNLNESNSRLRTARSSMTAFIEDDTSSTRGINLLKEKKRDLRRIADALILANLCDIRDYQKLISIVSAAEGNIIGHLVLGLLREVESSISHYESRLQRANLYLHMPVDDFPIQSVVLYQCAESMIRHYENILRAQNNLRNHLNSRIELYNTIEHETRLLFREGDELRDEAMRGFTMVNQAAAGLPNSFTHSGLIEWRGNLQTKREEFNHLQDEKIEAAEEFITLMSDSGILFPSGWSDEDKLEFAKRYSSEIHLLHALMNENFPETDFGTNYRESLDFQVAKQTTWFFIADPELAFYLTFEQRKELLEIFKSTTMHRPVKDYFEYLRNSGLTLDREGWWSLESQASLVYRAAVSGQSFNDWWASAFAVGGFQHFGIKLPSFHTTFPQTPPVQNNPSLFKKPQTPPRAERLDLVKKSPESKSKSNEMPDNRQALHDNLISRGFVCKGTTAGGYVEYKHPDGRTVWIRPDGEVITIARQWLPDGSKKIPVRFYWDGTPVEKGGHNTFEYVEPLHDADFVPPQK